MTDRGAGLARAMGSGGAPFFKLEAIFQRTYSGICNPN